MADRIDTSYFDLRHTFESAQPLTFHADAEIEKGYMRYSTYDDVLQLRFFGDSRSGSIHMKSLAGMPEHCVEKEVVRRFRLNDDLPKIYKMINTDNAIGNATRHFHGMRLTLNDPWEATLCFIVSQFNNVKRIRLIVRKLIATYGMEIKDKEGRVIGKAFPRSEDLAGATEKELMECGTGFRGRYIASAAKFCTNNLDLYKLNAKDYDSLMENLMEIDGVGEKVADCVALMGYGNLRAFPIDVWVKRTLEKMYFNGKDKNIKYLKEFAQERWGDYAGYAQQYIFWHGREIMKK